MARYVYVIEWLVESEDYGLIEHEILDGCGAFKTFDDALAACVECAREDIIAYLEDDGLDPEDESLWPPIVSDDSGVWFQYHDRVLGDRIVTHRVVELALHE